MAYFTEQQLEEYLGVTITGLTAYIEMLEESTRDYIERYCGNEKKSGIKRREFDNNDVDATKYYDGNGLTHIQIDDLRTLTSLVVDGETLTVDDDFLLYPLNEDVKETIELIQPSTRLNMNSRIQSSAPYIFDEGQKMIEVTGKFGYSADGSTPATIKMVAIRLAGAIIKENIGSTQMKEITSETLGEYSVTFAKIKDIANRLNVNAMLDGYLRQPYKTNENIIQIS